MNNYEYIVASLPDISLSRSGVDSVDTSAIIADITNLCSDKDKGTINLLLEGFDDKTLGEAFYRKALDSSDNFVRQYFTYDLHMRNMKARYVNRALGRKDDTDIFMADGKEYDSDSRLSALFGSGDVLALEKGLDALLWETVDEINVFQYFSLDSILGFIVKLHIVSRWLSLDPESGKEMFSKLVKEVTATYSSARDASGIF